MRDAGYIVSVICPTGRGFDRRHEVVEGIEVYRHPLPVEAQRPRDYLREYSAALLWQFVLTWKVLRRRGFDVVHACNPPDLVFISGGFFKLFLRKKFLFDHHDLSPELYEAKFGRRDWAYRLLLVLERWTFKTADVSIATNESYRAVAIQRGGMDAARVFVVRSGPKLDRVRLAPSVDALRHGRAHLVGYVGVMGEQEGIDLLLRAVAYIVHELGRDDIHFTLVGSGTSLDGMRAYAKQLGIADHVTFTGRATDELLFQVLSTADVCVNPDPPNALNDKSTMNKIMEYMALGKPIVQFDLTEGRFSAGDASLYAANDEQDFARKIVELIDDPERRKRMGEFGRRRVAEELEWSHEAPRLLAAYDALFSAERISSEPRPQQTAR